MMDLDVKVLWKQINDYNDLLKRLLQLKEKSYCLICNKQSPFDSTGTTLKVTDEFCLFLVQENKTYLQIQNQFINLNHILVQYLSCFMSTGRANQFPFPY